MPNYVRLCPVLPLALWGGTTHKYTWARPAAEPEIVEYLLTVAVVDADSK
jgi:hypothetical protein